MSFLHNSKSAISRTSLGITLIEILIGMAITLIMMAAVVNLFANIGQSVSNRRAAMEMNNQLRVVRAQLYNDLAGATCPAKTWQRPGSDNGYIEIIEGRWTDTEPSALTDGITINGELDYATSQVPSGGDPEVIPPNVATVDAKTNGFGLGDYDDVLALTVRSTGEPFIGEVVTLRDDNDPSDPVDPTDPNDWEARIIRSHYAEIIWYSVENPADGSLGEPGMRTVYRRVLLIAPWVTLPSGVKETNFFQRYDISARTDGAGNWVANTLSDLTKRENRFLRVADPTLYPHLMVSTGSGFGAGASQTVNTMGGGTDDLRVPARIQWFANGNGQITNYIVDPDSRGRFDSTGGIPEIQITGGTTNPSPRPVMGRIGQVEIGTNNFVEAWEVVQVTNGPAPLAYSRFGEDVMLNDVLAFDLRVYDPGAPIASLTTGTLVNALEPSDAGWYAPSSASEVIGFGAYVDLGWDPGVNYDYSLIADAPLPLFQQARQPGWHPRTGTTVGYGFPAVYDTWSLHYESDGIDQDFSSDNNSGVDEGKNGLDDDFVNGVDDPGERETSPPYDVPLRGIQVKLRLYERDTRQIRQATVTKSFEN